MFKSSSHRSVATFLAIFPFFLNGTEVHPNSIYSKKIKNEVKKRMVSYFCGIDLNIAHVTQTLIYHGNLAAQKNYKRKLCEILADGSQLDIKLFSIFNLL